MKRLVTALLVCFLLFPSAGFAHLSRYERRTAAHELARMKHKFHLKNVRIVWTYKTHGYQAICFYRSGVIKINPHRRASIKRIVRHEVGHIIDWRDNHHIDWGERIPRRIMR